MTVIYMDKKMILKNPDNKNQINDWNTWCQGGNWRNNQYADKPGALLMELHYTCTYWGLREETGASMFLTRVLRDGVTMESKSASRKK